MKPSLYIGLMSGTSMDGVDAVLVEFDAVTGATPHLRATHSMRMPPELRAAILALTQPGTNEIDRMGELDAELGGLFATAAQALLQAAGIDAAAVRAIGSHGQTIRHRPRAAAPFTLQIGDPNTIAEMTGITTVADFRRRDVAAGGQGAPLVPAFHAAVFASPKEDRVVLNLGGMANVTLLARNRTDVRGFDTGPANVLLDAWHDQHHGAPLDQDGAWSRSGNISAALLAHLLNDSYFAEPPPKSTGRERFAIDWLHRKLAAGYGDLPAADVQATLAELTARSVADALGRWGFTGGSLYVCGGGAHNRFLCERLAAALPRMRLASTAELGVAPDHVEAMAFAWLAERTINSLAGNLPSVTGARHPVILGGVYPGRPLPPA